MVLLGSLVYLRLVEIFKEPRRVMEGVAKTNLRLVEIFKEPRPREKLAEKHIYA